MAADRCGTPFMPVAMLPARWRGPSVAECRDHWSDEKSAVLVDVVQLERRPF